MNTKTLVAYGLAATMIGGSLVGANALTNAGASPSTEVQIVQSDAELDPIPVVTAAPATTLATSPPAALEAAAPSDGPQPDDLAIEEPYDEYENDEHDDNDEHEDEYDHGE